MISLSYVLGRRPVLSLMKNLKILTGEPLYVKGLK